MVAIRQYVAEQWPRYVVGLFGTYGLLSAIYLIASTGRSVRKNPPTEDERIGAIVVLIFASLSLIQNSVVLYAAVRKSVAAVKFCLVIYCLGLVVSVISILMLAVAFFSGDEESRKTIPHIGSQVILSIVLNIAYGWSLLVLLRDVRGQARDKWGRLLNYKNGELESAGPIRL
ncbi:hypothetical protein BGZ80_005651 [Entomortierella chlamydospora]|uniref:Uncharacterized protein n=1 Tax=Entomortierella chlamydospora TaxID=101097 RepID=A0A9P6SUS2_9FUNG|nr:hypothetical protein BGZ79_004283 [Entomortierella chlamydospora]KAG0004240.1 hypothetical protein BGZ80_005651 [Entomortierella chlamydospora]